MDQVLFGSESFLSDFPGLKIWLDAKTIAQADGSSVTTWKDQSGFNAHFNQSTTASKPIYKTNIINGNPVVRFDGVDDTMTITDSTKLNIANNIPGITIIVVGNFTQRALQQALFCIMRNDTTTPRVQLNVTTSNYYALSGTRTDAETNAAAFTSTVCGSNAIYTVIWSPSILIQVQYINGIIKSSAAFQSTGNFAATNATSINIGATGTGSSLFTQGDFGEIIVFNRSLKAGELTVIHQYLSKKWGIALA